MLEPGVRTLLANAPETEALKSVSNLSRGQPWRPRTHSWRAVALGPGESLTGDFDVLEADFAGLDRRRFAALGETLNLELDRLARVR